MKRNGGLCQQVFSCFGFFGTGGSVSWIEDVRFIFCKKDMKDIFLQNAKNLSVFPLRFDQYCETYGVSMEEARKIKPPGFSTFYRFLRLFITFLTDYLQSTILSLY